MLSFKKSKLIISSLLFFLFSCGYQPLINVNKPNESLFNSGKFEIFSPENDIGFQIRENLLTDFGFPKNPKYKINATSYPGKIVLSPCEVKMGIQLKTFIQKEFLKENMHLNMFFAICEDHNATDIDLALNVIQNIVLKLNMEDFDLKNDVKDQLVSPVFRPQK